jgi:hypothetical protein
VIARWLPIPEDHAPVHVASSEVEALLVQRLLNDAGIPAIVRSRQVPGYGEVIRRASGIWGDILVPAEHRADARQYVDDYLRALMAPAP